MRQILEGVGPACFGRDHWQALGMREPMANFQKNLVFDEFCNTTLVLGRDGVNIGIAHHGTVGLLRRLKSNTAGESSSRRSRGFMQRMQSVRNKA